MKTIKMDLVTSIDEIKHNLITVDRYINSGNNVTRDAMYSLISAGRNFVAYRVGNDYHFAPSRFVGYKNNSLRKHENNDFKNGTHTSNRLRRVNMLGQDIQHKNLEALLDNSCTAAGHKLNHNVHTFWIIDSDIETDIERSIIDSEFEEGKETETLHKSHERNTKMIRLAKANYILKHGSVCEICGFDFEIKYGKVGKGFIEAHHTVPVCELKEGDKTRINDIAFVCANCHRMLHRNSEWLTKQKLCDIISNNE